MNKRIIFQIYLIFSLLFVIPISFSATTTQGQAGSAFCGTPVNIKDSLVLSIVSMCLPGILDKAYEWKQIKCQTIKCSYNAVLNDLDPSFCVQQEAYRTCKYVVGEAFAIPPFSFLEFYRNAISQVIANPVGFLFSTAAKTSRKILETCSAGAGCSVPLHGVPALIVATTDILGVAQTLMEIFENGFSYFFHESVDYCEGLDDIREELEEIVGISSENDFEDE